MKLDKIYGHKWEFPRFESTGTDLFIHFFFYTEEKYPDRQFLLLNETME